MPSTLSYSFYIVAFWETPQYFTFCHHGSSWCGRGSGQPPFQNRNPISILIPIPLKNPKIEQLGG